MNEPRQTRQPTDYAFFFDIDGTLAPFQTVPQDVSIPSHVIGQLGILRDRLGGALAFVSGRPLEQIDALTRPLQGGAAGIHGAEIRTLDGKVTRASIDTQQLSQIEQMLAEQTRAFKGVLIEKKSMAFALHYRQAPDAQRPLQALANTVVERYPDFKVQAGKCVWEIKPRSCDKGKAIRFLMESAPFFGRVPVFLGDDITDEAGFRYVNQQQGVSIKIGEGESEAIHRIAGVTQVYEWLDDLINYKINIDSLRSV